MKKNELYDILQELYDATDKIDSLYSNYVVKASSACYSTAEEQLKHLKNINTLSDMEYYEIKKTFEKVRTVLKNR